MASSALDPPFVGECELVHKIAQGGMAEVFLARRHAGLGAEKLVVVKRVLPTYARLETFRRMFRDEARTAASLHHRHIVDVFEIGENEGQDYIVMEFLHGQSLRSVVDASAARRRAVPWRCSLKIVADVARALHHAHTRQDPDGTPLRIIHRDIKPANVIVTYQGVTKVVDFGVAKAAHQAHETHPGVVRGTVAYMSPEQVRAQPLGPASDQFSIGVILWELTTGRRLFKRDNRVAARRAVAQCEVPRPTAVFPLYPTELESIAMQALQRDPAKRHETCAAFADALEAFAASASMQCDDAGLAQLLDGLWDRSTRRKAVQESAWSLAESATPAVPAPARPEPRPTLPRLPPPGTAPEGHLALIATSIEGADALWEHDPALMRDALQVHADVFLTELAAERGYASDPHGEQWLIAFRSVAVATRWCVAVQEALRDASWPTPLLWSRWGAAVADAGGNLVFRGLRVRMAVTVGEPTLSLNPISGRMDYEGAGVDECRELARHARGGQILLAAVAVEALGPSDLPAGRELRSAESPPGVHELARPGGGRPDHGTAVDLTPAPGTDPVPLIGRQREVRDLKTRLLGGQRLLTVLGPPGVGKTRLARQVLKEMGEKWDALFCDLATARDAQDILFEIASALDLPVTQLDEQRVRDRLGNALHARGQVLLLLDNCEGAAAHAEGALSSLLDAAPDAHFLVTSRVKLGLAVEETARLEPLPVPRLAKDAPDSDAFRLFVARAREANAAFRVPKDGVPAVIRLLQRLEGIPLALEVAAARARGRAPEDFLPWIEQEAAQQQGSAGPLAHALRGSWSQLSPAERSALAQCTVFRGGFSLSAAERVVDVTDAGPALHVADVIQALLDKSMLTIAVVDPSGRRLRFRMLEAIREFVELQGDDPLADAGAIERHATYFIEAAERWYHGFQDHGGVREYRALEAESANILAVYRRRARVGTMVAVADAARAFVCMVPVLWRRGPFRTLYRIATELVASPHFLQLPLDLQALVHRAHVDVTYRLQGAAEARPLAQHALRIASQAEDPSLQPQIGRRLAVMEFECGNMEAGRSRLEDVRRRALDCGDLRSAAWAQLNMVRVTRPAGRLEEEKLSLRQALRTFRDLGDRFGECRALNSLGVTYYMQGDLRRAAVCWQTALDSLAGSVEQTIAGDLLGNLGLLEQERGNFERAERLMQRCIQFRKLTGSRRMEGVDVGYLATLYQESGRLASARTHYEAAIAILAELDEIRFRPLFVACLGGVEALLGDVDGGRETLETAKQQARHDIAVAVDALWGVAEIAAGEIDIARARIGAWNAPHDTTDPDAHVAASSDDVRIARRLVEAALAAHSSETNERE